MRTLSWLSGRPSALVLGAAAVLVLLTVACYQYVPSRPTAAATTGMFVRLTADAPFELQATDSTQPAPLCHAQLFEGIVEQVSADALVLRQRGRVVARADSVGVIRFCPRAQRVRVQTRPDMRVSSVRVERFWTVVIVGSLVGAAAVFLYWGGF